LEATNLIGIFLRIPNFIVAAVIEPFWDFYDRSSRLKTVSRLSRQQFCSVEELQLRREKLLGKLLKHAYESSSFWHTRMDSANIELTDQMTIADIVDMPLLTKDDVRSAGQSLLSSKYKTEELTKAKTGGSTGVALEVWCDKIGVEKRNGAAIHADKWSGWQVGQPQAAVWGNPPEPKTFKNKIRLWLKDRVIYLDTMKVSDESVQKFADQWSLLRPGLLYGHAHSIYLLATIVRKLGIKLRPTGIVATSMMLIKKERKVIEEVFNIPVTNRYGCEEVSLIACECELHDGLHINEEHIFLELLKDDGTHCQPGENGRVVVTELINYGMPMIRYETGDMAILKESLCDCGRPTQLLESVTGRTADFLVAADGSMVAGISLIENSLTRYPGIEQMQVVQKQVDQLELRIVKSDQWDDSLPNILKSVFCDALGTGCNVTISYHNTIPREPSGKYRFSICEVDSA
jgi:phenylacetate-CoA ligase